MGQVRYEWDFLPGDLRTAGAHTMGVYNPDGDQPLPITPDTPMDAVLATIVDPELNVVFPGALDAFPPNPDGINVPLRDVGTWTTGLINHLNSDEPLVDRSRVSLPFDVDAQIATQAQSGTLSSDSITLGDWLKASGKMTIRCKPEDHAKLSIKVKATIL